MAATITQFTPPASCSTLWFGRKSGDVGNALFRGVRCSTNTIFDDADCYPPTTASITGCPVSWTGALPTLSTTGCCPRGYSLTDINAACESPFPVPTLEAVYCTPGRAIGTAKLNFTFNPVVFLGNVKYTSVSETSSTKSSNPTSTSVTVSTSTSTSTNSPTQTTSDEGLSGGTIAGIAIGVIAGAALIVALVMLWERQKRRLAKENTPAASQPTVVPREVTGMNNFQYGAEAPALPSPRELDTIGGGPHFRQW